MADGPGRIGQGEMGTEDMRCALEQHDNFYEKTNCRTNIASDIMNRKTLVRLRNELKALRRNFTPYSHATLAAFARAVGRELENRGKEPNWLREADPSLTPPLSIPNHSKDIKAGTARSIIDQLLSDLDDWEILLDEQEKADDEKN